MAGASGVYNVVISCVVPLVPACLSVCLSVCKHRPRFSLTVSGAPPKSGSVGVGLSGDDNAVKSGASEKLGWFVRNICVRVRKREEEVGCYRESEKAPSGTAPTDEVSEKAHELAIFHSN